MCKIVCFISVIALRDSQVLATQYLNGLVFFLTRYKNLYTLILVLSSCIKKIHPRHSAFREKAEIPPYHPEVPWTDRCSTKKPLVSHRDRAF